MTKKTKSYSQVQATDALEQLGQRGTSAPEFIYDLLRIFAGYGDGQIRRTKEGPGNLAKDGETVLIKNLISYRQAPVNTLGGDCSKMYNVINAIACDVQTRRLFGNLGVITHSVDNIVHLRAIPTKRIYRSLTI